MPHSPLASPSATIDVLRSHGLYTRKSLGQHFLVDDNVIGRIMELAKLTGDEVVLEVGPGIGTLTVALVRAARGVVAIERDERLAKVLSDTVPSERMHLLLGDALDVGVEEVCTPFGPPDAFVANLPYAVAATLVLRFFETLPSLRFAVVMVQAEVASRMSAAPGGKDYGAYTVKLALHARPDGGFPVSRTSFLPPPRVDSAVLRLERRADAPDTRLASAAARVAEAAFAHRRKTLRNSLRANLGAGAGEIDAVLSSAGIAGERRPETLSVAEYESLGEAALRFGLLP